MISQTLSLHVILSFLLMILTKCQPIRTESDYRSLQLCLDDKLIDWSDKWKFLFHDSKCALMHFHKQKCPLLNHIYKIGSDPTHDTYRDLGIMLQCDLSWAKHYDYILSKAYRILGLLKRAFSMSNSVHQTEVVCFACSLSTLLL